MDADLDGDISLSSSRSMPRLDTIGVRRTPAPKQAVKVHPRLSRSQSVRNELESRAATPTLRLGWSRKPGDPEPRPLVDDLVRKRVNRWVEEIVVCNFDLDAGPVVERTIMGRPWGTGEEHNVAFSSFPDTFLFSEGNIKYSFRIRHNPPTIAVDDGAREYRDWDERGRPWLYGYVWFEQRRDESVARGYMQKSLVILALDPQPPLYFAMLDDIAPAFFREGYSALESACYDFADSDANLLLGSRTLQINIRKPLSIFRTCLPALWVLWECLVLAEPLLIVATDPQKCSEAVWCLLDLLRPIPTEGDYRPYMHIHDRDFALLVNPNKPQPGVLLGVTNPFFQQAASHWPNVLTLATGEFRTKVQRSISKDRVLLKKLEKMLAEDKSEDVDANQMLRSYFGRLSQEFLSPLEGYAQTLEGKPWSIPEFLEYQRRHSSLAFQSRGLTSRAKVETDFYAAFCKSSTFGIWLHTL